MQKLKSKEEYENLKLRSTILIVQIGSNKCLPCKSIKNKIDSWAEEYECVNTIYIPIEEFPDIAASEGIFAVPSVLVFAEKKLCIRESGYFSVQEIFLKLRRYIELI